MIRRTHPSTGYRSVPNGVPPPSLPATPSDGHASVGSDVERRSSNRRRRGNKKPPVSYPSELRDLIHHHPAGLIWGRRIPGIGSFDPSQDINRQPYYSVIHLSTSESLCVTQTQAFSGRDDEVEEWGSQCAMVFTARPRSTPPSTGVAHPAATWNPPSSPPNGTAPSDWDSTWLGVPQLPLCFLRSPSLPSEAGSVESSFSSGEYYDSNTEPPSSRASTSSGYEIAPYAAPTIAISDAGPSAHLNYYSHFENTVSVPCTMGPAGVFVPQQTQAMVGSFIYSTDSQSFETQAPLQYPPAASNSFSSAGGPSVPFYFGNMGTGGAYFGGEL